ncbi:MAG: biotin-dependent carboxyltransferase family protein [Betaproteobacteria bacterium]|nr:biotin-dependent carboxyltransferase family protein [Betaproteobacteria bacterium]
MTLRVLRPGVLATIQDLGRPGHQHLGVVPGGAVDPVSHRIANALVGNHADLATLEFALLGPELLFECDALIALHGAHCAAVIDGAPLPRSRPVLLPAGTRLRLGRAARGCFGYLAVAGGLDVAPVLGSRSTYLAGAFGGWRGRTLARGAEVPLAPHAVELARQRFSRITCRRHARAGPYWRTVRWLAPDLTLPEHEDCAIRALPGMHAELFDAASRERFYSEHWRIAPDSNRMGLCLTGPHLALAQPADVLSQATGRGTVQVPPAGQPIVLMADHQTTGGYPRMAEVIAADVPRVAQLAPGARVRFTRATLAEADAARETLASRVDRVVQGILWEYGDADD